MGDCSSFFHASVHWWESDKVCDILIALFLKSFIPLYVVWGMDNSFGIFLVEVTETYGTSRSLTSLVFSTRVGAMLCIGPISADLVEKFGCRKVIIVGSAVSLIGLIISGTIPNFIIFSLGAGIITGNLFLSQIASY